MICQNCHREFDIEFNGAELVYCAGEWMYKWICRECAEIEARNDQINARDEYLEEMEMQKSIRRERKRRSNESK